MQWLSENIASILILAATVGVIGLLIYSIIRGKRAAKASGNPACYGCPCAGKCHTGATRCTCNTGNTPENQANSPDNGK